MHLLLSSYYIIVSFLCTWRLVNYHPLTGYCLATRLPNCCHSIPHLRHPRPSHSSWAVAGYVSCYCCLPASAVSLTGSCLGASNFQE